MGEGERGKEEEVEGNGEEIEWNRVKMERSDRKWREVTGNEWSREELIKV